MRFLLLLSILLSVGKCFGVNYYVSSTTGSAKNSGYSPSQAKKTIQEVADLTKPGDTVFVLNGTYTNNCATCNVVNVTTSGKPDQYIVFTNYKGHCPKIAFNGWAGFSVRTGTSYIKIDGFEIVGNNKKVKLLAALKQPKSCANPSGGYDPKFNGNGIVIDGRDAAHPHHIVVKNNIVHDCGGGGISAIHADYITVEHNLVYNNSWYTVFGASGISFYQFRNADRAPGYHNVIRRNKCFNNKSMVPWFKTCQIEDGNGIIIDDFMNKQNKSANGLYTGKTLIENNVCWNNGGTGIHTFQSSFVDILNNTSYVNSRSRKLNAGEILAGSSSEVRIVNNILVTDAKNRINSNYQNKDITYENNLHYNISKPSSMLVSITSATCITGQNPAFKRPGNKINADFSLLDKSPAIGRANTQLFSRLDYNGKARAATKVADIGAYEF